MDLLLLYNISRNLNRTEGGNNGLGYQFVADLSILLLVYEEHSSVSVSSVRMNVWAVLRKKLIWWCKNCERKLRASDDPRHQMKWLRQDKTNREQSSEIVPINTEPKNQYVGGMTQGAKHKCCIHTHTINCRETTHTSWQLCCEVIQAIQTVWFQASVNEMHACVCVWAGKRNRKSNDWLQINMSWNVFFF